MEPRSLTENARITQLLPSYCLNRRTALPAEPSRGMSVAATSDAVFPPPHVKCLKVIKASQHASVELYV